MAEIVWTLEATRCLEEISSYISADSPAAADKVVSGICDKIQLLRTHPRLRQRYEPIADREVWEVLSGHFRIAYLLARGTFALRADAVCLPHAMYHRG